MSNAVPSSKPPNLYFADQFSKTESQIDQMTDHHIKISPFQGLLATQSTLYTPTNHFPGRKIIHRHCYSFKSKTENIPKRRSKPPKTLQKELENGKDGNQKCTFHVPINRRQRVKNQDQPDQNRSEDISPVDYHLFPLRLPLQLKSTNPLHLYPQIHTKFRQ